MLRPEFIKKYKHFLADCLIRRGQDDSIKIIDEVIELEESRKQLQYELDTNLADIKARSRNFFNKNEDNFNFDKSKQNDVKVLKNKLNGVKIELQEKLCCLPNILHSSVPTGTSIEDNLVIYNKQINPLKNIYYRPHWDLIKEYDIIDFELGTKIVGQGFPFYKGKGAKLQRALVSFLLDNAIEEGYQEIIPPILINKNSAYCTGQLPDMEEQMYEILNEDKFLIPTSEVPLTNIVSNSIFDLKSLPIKYTAHSQCFRREAGSWGSKVRGLNRLHQFEKIEIVQVSTIEDSYNIFYGMLEYLYKVLDKLEIPYRTINLCSKEIGFKAALQYDIEAWSFAQKQWLEISSLSNFESFQSHRLNLKYRDSSNKLQYAHTLNGSAFGMSRLLAVILENHQGVDCLNIPEALVPYTGFNKIK